MLLASDRVVGYFSSDLTHDDVRIHKHPIGADAGQQIWEALCILVALRAWAGQWMGLQITMCVKSDNMAALAMTSKLTFTSSRLIAMELALLLSEAAFQPRHVEHVPGVMNTWADALPRLSDPTKKYSIPDALLRAPRIFPVRRGESYYTSLAATSAGGV